MGRRTAVAAMNGVERRPLVWRGDVLGRPTPFRTRVFGEIPSDPLWRDIVDFADTACRTIDKAMVDILSAIEQPTQHEAVRDGIAALQKFVQTYAAQWSQRKQTAPRSCRGALDLMASSWSQAGGTIGILGLWSNAVAGGDAAQAQRFRDCAVNTDALSWVSNRGIAFRSTRTRGELLRSILNVLEATALHGEYRGDHLTLWLDPHAVPSAWPTRETAPWPLRLEDPYWHALFTVAGVVATADRPRHGRMQRVTLTLPRA
ncbi:MAG: hypothetical protein HY696_08565 [Deltaproteobacteria bacterium]|nr:hypothetical protein [Deltaproteobacteria bacterium]